MNLVALKNLRRVVDNIDPTKLNMSQWCNCALSYAAIDDWFIENFNMKMKKCREGALLPSAGDGKTFAQGFDLGEAVFGMTALESRRLFVGTNKTKYMVLCEIDSLIFREELARELSRSTAIDEMKSVGSAEYEPHGDLEVA
jgi:hypothetical protein